jgi:hypothetical protein
MTKQKKKPDDSVLDDFEGIEDEIIRDKVREVFHEFGNILSTVIEYYTRACESQENMDTFTNLAEEFYYTTQPDGYDAYHALKDVFPVGSAKRALVDFLIAEEDSEDGHVREEVHYVCRYELDFIKYIRNKCLFLINIVPH